MAKLQGLKSKKGMPAVMNNIRKYASPAYQNLVPVATFDNLSAVANPILQFEAVRNEFIDALINRIGMTLVKRADWQNPLRIFHRSLEFGQTVEEVFVDLAMEHDFVQVPPEDNLGDVYEVFLPDVKAVFHSENRQKFYPVTISEKQIRKAFLSWEGLESLIASCVQSLYTTNAYAEFELTKSMIAHAISENKFYNVIVGDVTDEQSAKDFCKKLRAYSNFATFLSRDYNSEHVATNCLLENQVLLIDPLVEAEISIEVLANAFNIAQADYLQRRILIDNFATETNTLACVVSEEWFMIFDTLFEMRSQQNARYLTDHYFLHVWQIFSYSPFEVAIRLTNDETATNDIPDEPEIDG